MEIMEKIVFYKRMLDINPVLDTKGYFSFAKTSNILKVIFSSLSKIFICSFNSLLNFYSTL